MTAIADRPIVTLTLNAALDVSCEADAVRPTDKIRTHGDRVDPGGGGINVSRVLQRLGAATHAIFLAAARRARRFLRSPVRLGTSPTHPLRARQLGPRAQGDADRRRHLPGQAEPRRTRGSRRPAPARASRPGPSGA